METTKINMGGEPQGKKETEKLHLDAENVNNKPVSDIWDDDEEEQDESTKKNRKGIARTVAAGLGGAAVGGGAAMAANTDFNPEQEQVVVEEQEEPEQPEESQPASKIEEKTVEDKTDDDKKDEVKKDEETTDEDDSGEDGPTPEQPSPHISEVLIDTEDVEEPSLLNSVLNIEGTGTTDYLGAERNAALVTDEYGNTFFLIDVDGEVGDPNANYDILVDAETGIPLTNIASDFTVSDAQLMADNGVDYIPPTQDDSNNLAQAEMDKDIYDPSQIADNMDTYDPSLEGTDTFAESVVGPMDGIGEDPSVDIIDPLA